MILEPALVGFGPEGSDQPEAARGGGKDPDHPRAPRDLLVAALTHVRALEMLVVVARQAGDVQGLADVRVDPVGALGVARRPAGEPRVEVLLGRLEVAPVVEPAPFLAAVIVGRARQRVEGRAEDMHVAALPDRFWEQRPDGPCDSRAP